MKGSFLLRLFCLLAFTAQVWAFDEGIDYTRLEQPQPTETGDKVEVLEFFWYGCPHCWHLEPELQAWVKKLPETVAFRRMPAPGGRWDAHARAFFAASMLDQLEVFHSALFEAIHEKHREIMTKGQLVAFAGEIGLDADAFRTAYESLPVDMQLRKAKEMFVRYGIDSVPAIIVDGRYGTSPSQTGGRKRMFEVLDSILAQELDSGS